MNLKESKRRLLNRKEGFTLIEIMLVIALIVILVGIGVINADKILGDNSEALTEVKIEGFKTPLFNYRMHMGSYPSTEEGLQALLQKPASDRGRWKGPYLDGKDAILDAWNTEFRYRYPSTNNPGSYDLYSLGADKVESEDDIVNWEK